MLDLLKFTNIRTKTKYFLKTFFHSNIHSFSLSMLQFISKHASIVIHVNFSILGLGRLNLTFLLVLHPSIQNFGSNGQAKLLVKLMTRS